MKEKTAMQILISRIESEILLNQQYRESPRLQEGARMVKIMAENLLSTENKQIVEAYIDGVYTECEGLDEVELKCVTDYANTHYSDKFQGYHT